MALRLRTAIPRLWQAQVRVPCLFPRDNDLLYKIAKTINLSETTDIICNSFQTLLPVRFQQTSAQEATKEKKFLIYRWVRVRVTMISLLTFEPQLKKNFKTVNPSLPKTTVCVFGLITPQI